MADVLLHRQSNGHGNGHSNGHGNGHHEWNGGPLHVRSYDGVDSLKPRSGSFSSPSSPSSFSHSSSSSSPVTQKAPMHPRIPLFTALTTYFGYALLMSIGHFRDAMRTVAGLLCRLIPWFSVIDKSTLTPQGYAPILSDFEDFYVRRLYLRIHDCWNRPIASSPGAYIDTIERTPLEYGKPLDFTGRLVRCLNLGSYNYLGFGDPDSPCKTAVLQVLEEWGVSTCSTRMSAGTTRIHVEAEQTVARYMGKQDAIVFGMGFATNSTAIGALAGPESLIVSDSLNHSSIAVGSRSGGATIRVFRHNDVADLEAVIRRAIVEGQPKTHRPWTKILILIEGIYSMEGETCPLREIVALKKKYNCYLYLDEAHSIGALGRTGRGVCEHAGVNPRDVDVCMGTFTKSFGSVGGYIAADKPIIDYLRHACSGSLFSAGISVPACQQITSAMRVIMGEDGTDIGQRKLRQLRDNSNYFRSRLAELGCHVLGESDSPVVPLMLYNPAKIPAFSRQCLKRGLAVVVVGFPASPLLLSRTRFCLSAAHTREDLEWAVRMIEEVCDELGLRYQRSLM